MCSKIHAQQFYIEAILVYSRGATGIVEKNINWHFPRRPVCGVVSNYKLVWTDFSKRCRLIVRNSCGFPDFHLILLPSHVRKGQGIRTRAALTFLKPVVLLNTKLDSFLDFLDGISR